MEDRIDMKKGSDKKPSCKLSEILIWLFWRQHRSYHWDNRKSLLCAALYTASAFFQMIENTDASQEVTHPKEMGPCSWKMLAVAKVKKCGKQLCPLKCSLDTWHYKNKHICIAGLVRWYRSAAPAKARLFGSWISISVTVLKWIQTTLHNSYKKALKLTKLELFLLVCFSVHLSSIFGIVCSCADRGWKKKKNWTELTNVSVQVQGGVMCCYHAAWYCICSETFHCCTLVPALCWENNSLQLAWASGFVFPFL